MAKLRDLILDKMTDAQKAKVLPHPKDAESMTDEKLASLPSKLDTIKNATKTG